MTLSAVGFLIVSAVLHTTWNFLLKQTKERYIVTWWALLVGSLFFLPLLFTGPAFSPSIWLRAGLSATVEAAYVVTLAAAYRQADFSLVYPIARGTAPALLALWSVLFLGERLSRHGILGLTVLVCGLMIIGSSAILRQRTATADWRSLMLAFLVAILISIYSAIDGSAVKSTDAIRYTVVVSWLTALLVTPFMFKRYGWRELKNGWAANRVRASAIGFLTVASYGLALIAFKIVPVGYSGAIRETGIVFGVFAGWLFLKEGFGKIRLLGSLLALAGILTIAIAG
ncbi:MAG TPA: DMT family transporter [Blastocatellia bacterium]|nr:DMT family transporter [Blastocatellia bacterium]